MARTGQTFQGLGQSVAKSSRATRFNNVLYESSVDETRERPKNDDGEDIAHRKILNSHALLGQTTSNPELVHVNGSHQIDTDSSTHNAKLKILGTITPTTKGSQKGVRVGNRRTGVASQKLGNKRISDGGKSDSLADISDSDADHELTRNATTSDEHNHPRSRSTCQKTSGRQSRARQRRSKRRGNISETDSLSRSSSRGRVRRAEISQRQNEARAAGRAAERRGIPNTIGPTDHRRRLSKASQSGQTGIQDILQESADGRLNASSRKRIYSAWFVILGFVVIVLSVFYLQSAATQDRKLIGRDDFRQQIEVLQTKYPKQSPRFWNTVITPISQALFAPDSKHPAVILVGVHRRRHNKALELLKDLSDILMRSLGKVPGTLIINEGDVARLSPRELHYMLDMSFQSGNKVVLVENLAALPSNATTAFYSFSDLDTALHKDVAFLVTVVLPDSVEKLTSSDVEKTLASKWKDIATLSAFCKRITNNIIVYEPSEC